MKVSNLTLTLLNAATTLHVLHFKSKSYSEHVTLGELYSTVNDLVDSIVEQYQGINGIIDDYDALAVVIPKVDAVSYVQNVYTMILDNRELFGKESHIQNTVDELLAAFATALYKLKNLK